MINQWKEIVSRRIHLFFFFNDTATTEIYTLSLHDALPICHPPGRGRDQPVEGSGGARSVRAAEDERLDRKSTRLNSSHSQISYAVFCLKKKRYQCQSHSPTRS